MDDGSSPHTVSMRAALERVLRGHFLRPEVLSEGSIDAPLGLLLRLGLVLGALYGLGLGAYALFQGNEQAHFQIFASAAKVPLLFLLTVIVTFPSLYVFAALQRLPLNFGATLRLLVLAILVQLAVLASLSPVFAFFAASTQSYPFMVLLNVAFFTVSGLMGLMVLRRATQAMFTVASGPPPLSPPANDQTVPTPPRVPPRAAMQARRLLAIWGFVYGVVGAQMGWLLRPFLGAPDKPFALLRPRESNFFAAVLEQLGALFGR